MMLKKRNLVNHLHRKRGQVTIFIIIAVLVVAGVLVYMFVPGFDTITRKIDLENPQQYIQTCVSDNMKEVTREVSLQGGSLNPEAHYLYQGEELEYLCYSNENYDLCDVQRPFLRTHIEEEIKSGISGQVETCFSSLKEEYENEGYDVRIEDEEMNVVILPEKVTANLNKTLYLRKEGNTETHKNFQVNLRNNLYNIIAVAESIVEWESAYGTAEPSLYMEIYHDLLVHKKEQGDKTTVYIIENVDTENKFQFASRSLVFPSGYGKPPEDIIEE